MSLGITQADGFRLKQAVIAIGALLVASQGYAQRADSGLFASLSGSWSGGGSIVMADGSAERIRCRANYSVHGAGRALNQNLRCASDSYQFNINANVASEGGAISGSWTESSRGLSGSVSGRGNANFIQAHVSGGSFSASMGIHTHGNSQSVTIRPQGGTDVSSVSITMRRG